jgi:hypothetical protein
MAPKGKYSEELVDRGVLALEETGRDCDAIKVMGVSHQTFYDWLGEKPEFREAVSAAKAAFTAKGWPKLRQVAQAALLTHLESVGKMETTRMVRTTTDPDGRITEVEEVKSSPVRLIPAAAALALEGGQNSREAYLMSQNLGTDPETVSDEQRGATVAERIKAGLGLK